MKKLTIKKVLTRIMFALFVIGAMIFITSCEMTVPQNSVGIKFKDDVFVELKGPGRHEEGGDRERIQIHDGNTKNTLWQNPFVWTSDGQEIELALLVEYARGLEEEDVKKMLRLYSLAATDDTELERIVVLRISDTVKRITTTYKIDEMVGLGKDKSKNRETLRNDIYEPLKLELKLCGIELINVFVENIEPSAEYKEEMQKKSLFILQEENLQQEKSLEMARITNEEQIADAEADSKVRRYEKDIEVLEKEKELEQAQTDLEVEKARREALVAAEMAKILQDPQTFELEKLKILAEIFRETDKWFFVEPGMDISYFLNNNGIDAIIPTE